MFNRISDNNKRIAKLCYFSLECFWGWYCYAIRVSDVEKFLTSGA